MVGPFSRANANTDGTGEINNFQVEILPGGGANAAAS
jgi:hypothetical protein